MSRPDSADSRSDEPEILYEIRDEIGYVTFNRPQARNALTFAMYDRVASICESAPTDGSVKAIVFSGAGDRAFAAGTDISLFRSFSSPEQGSPTKRRPTKTSLASKAAQSPQLLPFPARALVEGLVSRPAAICGSGRAI